MGEVEDVDLHVYKGWGKNNTIIRKEKKQKQNKTHNTVSKWCNRGSSMLDMQTSRECAWPDIYRLPNLRNTTLLSAGKTVCLLSTSNKGGANSFVGYEATQGHVRICKHMPDAVIWDSGRTVIDKTNRLTTTRWLNRSNFDFCYHYLMLFVFVSMYSVCVY